MESLCLFEGISRQCWLRTYERLPVSQPWRVTSPTTVASLRMPVQPACGIDSCRLATGISCYIPRRARLISEWIRRTIERNGIARSQFDVVSNPEFLREGTAVSDFLHPDRIVVGADTEAAAALLQLIYAPLTSGAYYARPDAIPGACTAAAPPPLLHTSAKSAEIIKHASNAFLALKISFINAVSNLCEATDANIEQVALGIGLDSRIGPRFLRPGIGYGGSCFPKDIAAFRSVAEQLGIEFYLLTEVEKINAEQKKRFLARVRSALWTLRGNALPCLASPSKAAPTTSANRQPSTWSRCCLPRVAPSPPTTPPL